jgi:PAS domain S-box-containing protein
VGDDAWRNAGERYRYLVANTPAIIYCSVPSGDFKMTFVSENAWRVLGYEPAEMLADPNFWFNHIHPDDASGIFSSLAMLFVDGQKAYEYRFRTRSGNYLWMHDTLRLIRDEQGLPTEVIGILTEITERKKMEAALKKKGDEQRELISQLKMAQAQLMQSEKMASIGQLAAGVAHEINNPIGFVSSNLSTLGDYIHTVLKLVDDYEALLKDDAEPESVRQKQQEIDAQADLEFLKGDVQELLAESQEGLKRVKDIVQSLKDFSRVGETNWQMADLHHGIDSTLNIANNELKYKVTVLRQYGCLPLVKCLPSELNQVFMNLLVNSAHAIKDQGCITIQTEHAEGWVTLRFSDTGCGIPPDNIKRIFEPFFTTKPVGSGTGLGLSLSYGILQKHGGTIEVTSIPNVRTTFTLRLPVNPEAKAVAADSQH